MKRRDGHTSFAPIAALEELNTQPAITYLRDLYQREGESRKWRPRSNINTDPSYRDIDRSVHADDGTGRACVLGVDRISASTLVAIAARCGPARSTTGLGVTGLRQPDDVGGLHHQLRLLGRYRALGHLDLRDSVSVPHPLAHRGLSRRRDHDGVRGRDRRPVPAHPSRPRVVLLLAAAVSQRALPAARFPLAAGLGRLRGQHLSDDQRAVLVDGADSRRRQRARESRPAGARSFYTRAGARMAGHRSINGAISRWLTCCWRASRRRWCSRCTSVVSWDFAMAQMPGWHSTIFAPYFVAGAIFSGVRDGADAAHPDAQDAQPRGSASRRGISTTSPRSFC